MSRKNQWGLSQHDQQHIPGLYDEHVIFHTLLFLQFYLSLENSLCKDYITEKFWKILPYNVIPIVLNGVNMTSIAPPHSYIDISDFSNFHGLYAFNELFLFLFIAEFAQYVLTVSKSPSLFASYFWWRDYYKEEFCDHKIVCHKKSYQEVFLFFNFTSSSFYH